ncbi:RBM7 protein, partial [Oxyruncus cristatus]|nr:RBM7 protein [Oxyruncus cristatus]
MGAAAAEANRTLFVGNLDPKVTEELIFELFHQAGPVITVKIPKDRDGRPKQFAFVNFKHEESVPYGLQLLNGIKLYGRPMRIQFRSGSSHAAQDTSLSCSPLGATGAIPPGMPHPASNCSRYERVPEGAAAAGFPLSLQRQAVVRPWHTLTGSTFGGKYEQLGFAPPGYPHAFHALPPGSPVPRRAEGLVPRKGRLGAHPYPPDSRHFGRERFGPDYGRSKRDDYGFDERGHDSEHHYRGSRDEPYNDRHRDGWSHDYDHRRESYREAKWHPVRH